MGPQDNLKDTGVNNPPFVTSSKTMAQASFVDLISWLIAGLIAGWFMYSISGRGPLGHITSGVVSLEGAVLGAWLLPLGFARLASVLAGQGASPNPTEWWFSVPAAFTGGLLADSLLRLVFHARHAP